MSYDHRNRTPDGLASQIIKSMLEDLNHLHCQNGCLVGSGGGSVGYLAHGTSTDYMYDIIKVPMSFTFEVRTFKGHTNEKNFVGLTVNNECIACGSETNEVFIYHKLGIGSVLPIWMIQTMMRHPTNEVPYVGRVTVQQC